jgi:penicillin amidase
MQRRVAAAAAPNSVEAALGRGYAPGGIVPHSLFAFGRTGHLVRLLRERPPGWFESWDSAIAASLAAAEATLRSSFGPDPAAWHWGTVRPLTLKHPIGSRRPFDRIFNIGPIPWSGDFTTVAQSGAPPLAPLGNPSAVGSLRMAIDVGDWDGARFALPGGQSGNPLSPHYDDQIDAWRIGLGVPLPWSEEAVQAATTRTLFVVPLKA